MKTILEFEVEEYEKMLSALDLPVEDEDKSQYFNAWNFGETVGEYFSYECQSYASYCGRTFS